MSEQTEATSRRIRAANFCGYLALICLTIGTSLAFFHGDAVALVLSGGIFSALAYVVERNL